MKIWITKISPTRHRFSYRLHDGAEEISRELETKSYLTHDFLHFCIESEAKTDKGFFGSLARGETYDELITKMDPLYGDIDARVIEGIVGALSSITKGRVDPQASIRYLENVFNSSGTKRPTFLTEEFIVNVRERYRKLIGEWNSKKFGETLELAFG